MRRPASVRINRLDHPTTPGATMVPRRPPGLPDPRYPSTALAPPTALPARQVSGGRPRAAFTDAYLRSAAQPTDPPWARLLFVLVEGWEGQCRRALMLVMPLVLLAATLVGLLALLPGWISGSALGMGIGTLGAFAASRRRRRSR